MVATGGLEVLSSSDPETVAIAEEDPLVAGVVDAVDMDVPLDSVVLLVWSSLCIEACPEPALVVVSVVIAESVAVSFVDTVLVVEDDLEVVALAIGCVFGLLAILSVEELVKDPERRIFLSLGSGCSSFSMQ